MYEFLFQTKVTTFVVALGVCGMSCLLAGRLQAVFRYFAFNFVPSFACAFYLVALTYDGPTSIFDLLSGFWFEFLVLIACASLFLDAFKRIRGPFALATDRWLLIGLALQITMSIPNIIGGGFGVFSEGSRIAYLGNNALAKYFAYGWGMITAAQAGLIAHRVSHRGSLGKVGWACVATTFALYVASGSKGAFFLWLASVASLVCWRKSGIRWTSIFAALVLTVGALGVSSAVVSSWMGISLSDFSELALSRFFLSNDSRALALDMSSNAPGLSALAAASFRSSFSLFGSGSHDPPLGALLYELAFNVDNGTGGNTSLMSLINYYTPLGYSLVPTLVAILVLGFLFIVIVAFRRTVTGSLRKMVVSLVGIVVLQLMSQDFLAFQLALPMATALGLLLLFHRHGHTRARYLRSQPSGQLANAQHHRPRP